ncbi:MAG: serine/threonine-protein kinase, partial [Acidobacteriota bacterium]
MTGPDPFDHVPSGPGGGSAGLIGAVLSGRYQVTGELGRGGMGVVYKSTDTLLRREVAIKMLSPTLVDATAERRIEAEARTVARLEHPAIVPIHDMGRHRDMLYLVMPLVAGETLKTLISRGELRLGDILEVGVQGAQALGYSHKKGVIHRDIKPGNLLLSRLGGQVRLRILDFGLARRFDEEDLTRSTRVAGTLAYLSPEQVESGGKSAEGPSDLYALGAVLYECLAGLPPFKGSLFSTLYRIVHEAPKTLSERGLTLDPELESIVLGCLAKDAADRPASGEELARRLARYRDQLAESEWARRTSQPAAAGRRERVGRAAAEPLLGRDAELRRLEERLARVLTGESGLTLIAGDAGTGKTRLARSLAELAQDRQFLVLQGRFSELETTFRFQALCELIEDYFRGGESSYGDRGAPELGDVAPDLLHLYPALA